LQLSIIILNYNVRYFLELCVISVQNAIQNLDAEIIVVDNNSSDDSCEMIKNRFPDIKLIENKENSGFPKGNNIGVDVAKGEYICILNPDTVVAENTFEKILHFINNNAQIPSSGVRGLGIVGCKLIDGTGNFLPECKRGTPTPFVAFTKIFGLYKISNLFGKYYAQHLSENQSGKVDILVGAFMIMKRELYQEIGGFDENCFMYSDDIDLSYMVTQKGFDNYYFHETSVIHYKGESTVKDVTYMKRFQVAMNFFYKKHFKISVFFSIFMKIGIVLFSFFKKFQGNSKPKVKSENYILISDNQNLKQKIENQFKKPVELLSRNFGITKSFSQKANTEIIFDNNYIDFKTIIELLELNKNKNFTFKILPKTSDFLIGSNSSNDRGEVIQIANLR
jgi:GT2 family glycosyltransferase